MQCVDLGGRRIIKKNFFKQKTAYEISECLVGSEMCIRDRFLAVPVERDELIGGNLEEKLMLGVVGWFFHMVSLSLIHI